MLLEAEEELIRWEAKVPNTDGLLLQAEAAVYLAQGRLDEIPLQKLNEFCRHGGDPTWLAILRMLAGQTDDAMELLQVGLDRRPLDNPSRMLMGEMLRTRGDTAGAIPFFWSARFNRIAAYDTCFLSHAGSSGCWPNGLG